MGWRSWSTEAGALGRLAFPLICYGISTHVCDLTDCLFLGRLGTVPLGAAGIAIAYIHLWFLLIFALQSTLTIVASQSFGAQKENVANLWFQRGLLICIISGGFVAFMWTQASLFLGLVNSQYSELGGLYAWWSLPRIPADILSGLLAAYLEAQEIVFPIAIASCVGMFTNAFANYALIYGVWDYGGYGFIGSPLATSMTAYVVLGVQWGIAMTLTVEIPQVEDENSSVAKDEWEKPPGLETTPLLLPPQPVQRRRGVLPSFLISRHAFNLQQLSAYLRLAFPQALSQYMGEAILFVMVFSAGSLGVLAIAANTVIFQIYDITTTCFFGIAQAACIRIGNAIGDGRIEDGKRTASLGVICGMLSGVGMGLVVWLGRDSILRVFTTDPEVVSLVAVALPCALSALVTDSIYVVITIGVLSGLGKTRLASLCCASLAGTSPLTYAAAHHWGFVGLYPSWLAGTFVVSVVSIYFWRTVDWTTATEECNDRIDTDDDMLLA